MPKVFKAASIRMGGTATNRPTSWSHSASLNDGRDAVDSPKSKPRSGLNLSYFGVQFVRPVSSLTINKPELTTAKVFDFHS